MTKVEAVRNFKDGYSDIKKAVNDDREAVKFDWSCYTDDLCKSGEITSNQYNNWYNPFSK